jgi:hypothetical protein
MARAARMAGQGARPVRPHWLHALAQDKPRLRRHETVAAERRRLGMAGQQQAVVRQQAGDGVRGACARGRVKIDQQVAAEYEVVRRRIAGRRSAGRQDARARAHRQQIALAEIDIGAQRVVDHVLVAMAREPALAEGQVGAAEGIAGEASGARPRDRGLRQIDRVDAAARGGDAGLRQHQRHRIRLFAAGAGYRQDAYRTQRLGRQAPLHEAQRFGEHGGVAQHPGFRHHHLVDQCLEFGRAGQRDVIVRLHGRQRSVAQRALQVGVGRRQAGAGVQGVAQAAQVKTHAAAPEPNSSAATSGASSRAGSISCSRPLAPPV